MDDKSKAQLRNIASLPFVHHHVAAMPDVHLGPEGSDHSVAKEHHYRANVWVNRKGAIRAREGDLGIVPGSMGARRYIVRGKGNPESF